MNIIIQSKKFRASRSLESFIIEKVSKLFNKSDRIIRADVILQEGEHGVQENKYCEIRLVVPGNDYIVKKNSNVYEQSVLMAVDILQKILRRSKTKSIAKRHRKNHLLTVPV